MNDRPTSEPQFDEDEIAEIIRLASNAQDAQQATIGPRHGLTLSELQQVGTEVGLRPELIAQAALQVRSTAAPLPARRFMGVPLSASHGVELARPLSDAEWDQLVVMLRETFGATGTVRQDGRLRQWRNGNLTAAVEPAGTSERFRIWTRKGNAATTAMLGLVTAVTGGFLLAASPGSALIGTAMSAGGLALAASLWFTLPRWAGRRKAQMELVAARATALVGSGS